MAAPEPERTHMAKIYYLHPYSLQQKSNVSRPFVSLRFSTAYDACGNNIKNYSNRLNYTYTLVRWILTGPNWRSLTLSGTD